jgi:uncharacterized protein YbjT (DUF2867 family)
VSKSPTETVRILRPANVAGDSHGQSSESVEEAELALVSTLMLKNLLDSSSDENKRRLEEAARGKEGVLAQHLGSGRFEIIDDDDLREALRSDTDSAASKRMADVTWEPLMERADTDDDELSLVSTQALRRMLGQEKDEPEEDLSIDIGGFDPYNSA